MSTETKSHLTTAVVTNQAALLEGWLSTLASLQTRRDKGSEAEIRQQASLFLNLLPKALASGDHDINKPAWDEIKQLLSEISKSRASQGISPIDTALFIFSLKEPLFSYLQTSISNDPLALVHETTAASILFDKLGLYTVEAYQKTRESIIQRQQQELLELSTPVVQLWENILALPLIGTLDSARTQVVMESLLQKIVETGALIAIIDITGVPTVDTLVAQHLLKAIAAARLMGADCIISGIRPQIAQTIVHLGVNLEDVITKATLADAFNIALKRTGATLSSK